MLPGVSWGVSYHSFQNRRSVSERHRQFEGLSFAQSSGELLASSTARWRASAGRRELVGPDGVRRGPSDNGGQPRGEQIPHGPRTGPGAARLWRIHHEAGFTFYKMSDAFKTSGVHARWWHAVVAVSLATLAPNRSRIR